MSSVYREDRYDDSKTTVTTRRDGDNITRVTKYVIREDRDDDDVRSNYTSRTRRTTAEPKRSVPEYVERDLVIRSSHDDSPRSPRRDYWHDRDREETDRELIIRRRVETDSPRRGEREHERDLTITRVEDRHDESRDHHQYDRDRDLQHYTRTSEYYGPQQPQTIIIRQDPIIIRERVRDEDYQVVKRSDVDEERSVVRKDREDEREHRDERDDRDEEFFYEKKVRERFDDRDYDRRSRRGDREISPGDSISQAGRRRDRSYSSDDSMVYVRRVKDGYGSREASPDRKKNLAAGVIAGVGAAELLRNHRKKEGKDTSSGVGRVGRDIGAGALGALAAEGIQRARSEYRSRSRRRRRDSRDRSWSGDRSRYRSRSRSSSRHGLKTLGAVGLGAAALAAAAAIASRNKNSNAAKPEKRRSRSRRRHSSVESLRSLENDPSADDARNPKHRNQRIAAAGAVGAAAAGLIERARSRSRPRTGSRSPSRVDKALPVVAAGLGTAALAGLFEKNKAKREAEKIQKEQKREARSRSRPRSVGPDQASYDDSRGAPGTSNDRYVSYGEGPMFGNNYGEGYYGRPAPQEPYYNSNSQAVVPAEASRSVRSRSRSMSRDRRGRRSISPSSEEDRRAISRGAPAAGVAGAAGVAYHENRKQEKRDRKARQREQERYGDEGYDDGYQPQNFNAPQPPPAVDPYASQSGFYPSASQFPPPPGSMPQQYPSSTPQPSVGYGPQQSNAYNGQGGPNHPNNPYGNQMYSPQNYSTQSFNPPPPGPAPQNQGYDAYASGGNHYAPPQNRGADENVSAGSSFAQQLPSDQHEFVPDGVRTPRPREQPPSINVIPPSLASTAPQSTTSIPNLTIPASYVPPNERPDTPPSRHVQFASSPDATRSLNDGNDTSDTDNLSPDSRRQRRRLHENNHAYDASEDTDTSPTEDPRSRGFESRSGKDRDSSNRRTSTANRDRNREGRRSSRTGPGPTSRHDRNGQNDGNDSDSTIELEPRFDEKGQKKAERGDGQSGDRYNDILAGRGAAGKLFGNFMEGLVGGDRDRDGRGGS